MKTIITQILALADPFLSSTPETRKRLEQLDLKSVRSALIFQTAIWPLIYMLHLYFNDVLKTPHSLYVHFLSNWCCRCDSTNWGSCLRSKT